MPTSRRTAPGFRWQVAGLLLLVIASAWFTVRIFQGFDEMIGDRFWVVDVKRGGGWYGLGLLPHLESVPREEVFRANGDADPTNDLRIYAQKGDFAADEFYGVCFGMALLLYMIWYPFVIGFPGRVDPYLLPRRILTVVMVTVCSVTTNLLLVRLSASMVTDPMTRLVTTLGYPAALSFLAAGVWFSLLFHALGAETTLETLQPRSWGSRSGEELSWLAILFALVTLVENVLLQNRLALGEACSDYPLWITVTLVFVQLFGGAPRHWVRHLGGIGGVAGGTVATLLLFMVLERVTGMVGAGFASPLLARTLGPEHEDVGFSLMAAVYLLFWMTFTAALRRLPGTLSAR